AFFIFLYILLIGPGDYLFLKRVLKRMELTWITFPTIVVTVSLLAYYAAYVVKGKELRVNKVDVVDIDQTTGLARGSVWMNLFSLSSGGYAYEPFAAAERLDGVRVPIWSTKCLTARWIGPSAALVEADLQPVGTDRLSGTITNRQSVPLKDAILAFGNQVYEL